MENTTEELPVFITEENKHEVVGELMERAGVLLDLLRSDKLVHTYFVLSTLHLFGKPISEQDNMVMVLLNIAIDNEIARRAAIEKELDIE